MTKMCDVCGLPQELCICEDISKKETTIDVYIDERKFNHVTIASGFDTDDMDISELSSELKSKFACGGTFNENKIELQGNHQDKLVETLKEKGFNIK